MPLGGSCEGGKVSAHWEVPSLRGTEGKLWSLRGEHSIRWVESKAERDMHRRSAPTGTPQPEMLVSSPAGAGGGCVLRLWKSEPGERTGVGCVKTALGGQNVVHHSGGSPGRSLGLPERPVTIVGGFMRRGGPAIDVHFSVHSQAAGHHLNECQGCTRATAAILDPRGGSGLLPLLPLPTRIL